MTPGLIDELTDDERAILSGSAQAETGANDQGAIKSEDNAADQDAADQAAADSGSDKAGADHAAVESKGEDGQKDEDEGLETADIPNRGRFVRYGALHAERAERKRLQEELRKRETEFTELRERMARADERLRLLLESVGGAGTNQQPAKNDQPPPDPEQDIFGYVRWLGEKLQSVEGKAGTVENLSRQQQAEMELQRAYLADAQSYAAKEPSFRDAYQFLMAGRDAELQAFGIADASERARIIMSEERALVERALRDGVSPSARVFALAKARGFAPPAPPAQTTNGSGRQQSGSTSDAAKSNPAAAKIEQIQSGQRAAKSLSNAGGSAGEVLTMEALANMSEEEYRRIRAKLSNAKFAEILGAA